ncbi:hypothetical protein [Bosea lathyri]|nr:hypothetical protein [Bosea lathyri]
MTVVFLGLRPQNLKEVQHRDGGIIRSMAVSRATASQRAASFYV